MKTSDILLLIMVAAIWGANFTVIRLGLDVTPPILLTAMRFIITAFPAVFFLPRPTVGWKMIVAIGLTLGLLMSLSQFAGIYLGAAPGISSVALQMQVVFTAIFAHIFLKERLGWRDLLAIALGVVGMLFIGWDALGKGSLVGLGLMIFAAMWWGAGNILVSRAQTNNVVALMAWMSLVPIIPLFALSVWIEGPMTRTLFALIHPKAVMAALSLGLGVMIIGYGIWGHMLQKYDTGKVAPFSLLVPAFGLFFAHLILGEKISQTQIIGVVFIVGALLTRALPSEFGKVVS